MRGRALHLAQGSFLRDWTSLASGLS
uniref:Uncharacterized protein n=1 Tax=Anguilla anguilla TaxID=7936 RepID=A0A0E9PSU9_ANGAN